MKKSSTSFTLAVVVTAVSLPALNLLSSMLVIPLYNYVYENAVSEALPMIFFYLGEFLNVMTIALSCAAVIYAAALGIGRAFAMLGIVFALNLLDLGFRFFLDCVNADLLTYEPSQILGVVLKGGINSLFVLLRLLVVMLIVFFVSSALKKRGAFTLAVTGVFDFKSPLSVGAICAMLVFALPELIAELYTTIPYLISYGSVLYKSEIVTIVTAYFVIFATAVLILFTSLLLCMLYGNRHEKLSAQH